MPVQLGVSSMSETPSISRSEFAGGIDDRHSKVEFNDLNKTLFYSYGTLLFSSTSFFATPFLLLKRRLQMGYDMSVVQLWKREGTTGSFRGASLSWISGVNRMVYFTIYEKALTTFENLNVESNSPSLAPSQKAKKSASSATAAAIASITSQAVLTPVAVVTTRLHINQGPLISAWKVMNSIVSQHGRYGVLWTGYSSALLQAVPLNMTLFWVYTYSKHHAYEMGLMNTPRSDLAVRFACSLLGTYAAVLVTAPIDIVRTHRQALVSDSICITSSSGVKMMSPVPSSLEILKSIYSKHGVRYIFGTGSNARLLSSTPFTVAMLIGYDYIKLAARKIEGKEDHGNY
jgi:hypothetical protein